MNVTQQLKIFNVYLFERSNMMQLQGPVRFTRRVDVPTFETFLRTQGMSEKRIDSLTIQFVREIPPPIVTILKIFPRPWGRCDLWRNRILLATNALQLSLRSTTSYGVK